MDLFFISTQLTWAFGLWTSSWDHQSEIAKARCRRD